MGGIIMITKRNIALCVILSIVTCGLYGIYWFVTLHNDTEEAAGQADASSAVVAFLLTIVTCGFYGLYWCYKRGQLIEQAYKMRGIQESDKAVIYLILSIVGLSIVAYALAQNELNKIADIDSGSK